MIENMAIMLAIILIILFWAWPVFIAIASYFFAATSKLEVAFQVLGRSYACWLLVTLFSEAIDLGFKYLLFPYSVNCAAENLDCIDWLLSFSDIVNEWQYIVIHLIGLAIAIYISLKYVKTFNKTLQIDR